MAKVRRTPVPEALRPLKPIEGKGIPWVMPMPQRIPPVGTIVDFGDYKATVTSIESDWRNPPGAAVIVWVMPEQGPTKERKRQ